MYDYNQQQQVNGDPNRVNNIYQRQYNGFDDADINNTNNNIISNILDPVDNFYHTSAIDCNSASVFKYDNRISQDYEINRIKRTYDGNNLVSDINSEAEPIVNSHDLLYSYTNNMIPKNNNSLNNNNGSHPNAGVNHQFSSPIGSNSSINSGTENKKQYTQLFAETQRHLNSKDLYSQEDLNVLRISRENSGTGTNIVSNSNLDNISNNNNNTPYHPTQSHIYESPNQNPQFYKLKGEEHITEAITPNSNNSGNGDQNVLSDEILKRRKKEQNRTAQKAFRERKEAKLKELEIKLKESEHHRESLLQEMEELKKKSLEISIENKLLLESGGDPLKSSLLLDHKHAKFTFPSKNEFSEYLVDLDKHHVDTVNELKTLKYDINQGQEELLTVPATWEYLNDLLNEYEMNQSVCNSGTSDNNSNSTFDIYYIMSELKGHEVCHGHGPAYYKSFINKLVENARFNK
ncbi:uncharacterized protein SCODWIG_00817 [Saccharomycodes ludwigii]|uniref:BZIP domain-containing protein n=1 Tax=Saccharomycodes ludwigii TaxID=36035 RepID=A0A376B2Z5_9ASCO|nr:uncharacterized protein SCODWIG_00817 [Saccharomycodes ludwigii]